MDARLLGRNVDEMGKRLRKRITSVTALMREQKRISRGRKRRW